MMLQMGKRIKKLEKEGAQWRAKWENSNRALLDMAEEVSTTGLLSLSTPLTCLCVCEWIRCGFFFRLFKI